VIRASEVIVVGGGVIGAAVAYNLARDGQQVTLLERRGIAAEASGANVGLVTLTTKPRGPLFELARTSLGMFRTLREELESEIHYQRPGVLHVFASEEKRAETLAKVPEWRSLGITCRVLDGGETRALEPVLSPAVLGSVWADTDGMVWPFALTMGFARAARRHGAKVEVGPDAEVTGLRAERGRLMGVETPAGFRPAGTVVLATGAWAKFLPAPLGIDVPVFPVWGQVLVTERAPRMIHHVIFGGEPTAGQTPFGNVIIGSTPEDRGFDKAVDLHLAREFASSVLRMFPGLRGLQVIRAWAGLRPGTADALPFMEWAPGVEGLFLACGHFRSGICYAPASGRIVADLMLRGKTWDWASAFTLRRFATAPEVAPA
jgi:glycine/D-amino acid oxidase-like deaminating enzyme